ncbi:MAG: dethiobiotin synthase [Nitrosomonadales bacterium]|nr:dethiobiotin synthase [Nitrosomonadales bacterium]
MNNTFFITGTDTGIGKTFVACILMQFIKSQQKKVIGMKPIAAGIDKARGENANEDVILIKSECSSKIGADEINTYSFIEPIAPHIAAQKNNVEIDLSKIKMHAENLKKRADYLFIEGAGGYLVPLNSNSTMADLVDELDIPTIVVIGVKLGCINHGLLTIEAILKRGQRIFGWVANIIDKDMLESGENISSLKKRIKAPLLGTIPYSPQHKIKDLKNYITWPIDL